jgi:hypothetical protein
VIIDVAVIVGGPVIIDVHVHGNATVDVDASTICGRQYV